MSEHLRERKDTKRKEKKRKNPRKAHVKSFHVDGTHSLTHSIKSDTSNTQNPTQPDPLSLMSISVQSS